jgi:HD-like signal output (HDOD) protein
MAETNKERLLKRLEHLDRIPTLPAALQPLLRYLDRPLDELDMNQVARMISSDESLASQCLHMANSPLFGRWQRWDCGACGRLRCPAACSGSRRGSAAGSIR